MRPRVLAGLVVVTAFALGFFIAGTRGRAEDSRPASARQAPAPTSTSSSRPAPHRDAETVNGERDHSEEGARRAAIAYATASQEWLYMGNDDIARSVRAIATDSAADSLSAETVAELGAARDALSKSAGPVWWLVRPLASRVERYQPSTTRVVVWTVSVLSAADVALPQADWARVAVELQWDGDEWRVQAIADTPGPTPMTGTKDHPWQPEPLDAALVGFERVGAEGQRP